MTAATLAPITMPRLLLAAFADGLSAIVLTELTSPVAVRNVVGCFGAGMPAMVEPEVADIAADVGRGGNVPIADIARSAVRISAADENRSLADFASAFMMMTSTDSGMAELRDRGDGRRLGEVREHDVAPALADERRRAAQHLVEDDPQRVDVGAVVDSSLTPRHCSGDMYSGVPISAPVLRLDRVRRAARRAAWRCRSRAP